MSSAPGDCPETAIPLTADATASASTTAERPADKSAVVSATHDTSASAGADEVGDSNQGDKEKIHWVDVIWQNLHAESDFSFFRKSSVGPIERILIDFAKVLDAGVFEQVISVCATKDTFTVTLACTKKLEEVSELILGV